MIKIEDFNQLVDRAVQESGRAHMRPVIAKELLHYDILYSLESNGLLDKLTFQGGTSLRLCYGANRYSEDLDFVGGYDFSTADLIDIKGCLEKYIGERYGLDISVKEPKEMAEEPSYKDVKVDKWQVKITTEPERKNLPKQKIKLEIANIPAYSKNPLALRQNYDFLPDGYSDIVILTKSLDEIMADKLVALVSCQRYVRYRDIWDLRWLKQKGAVVNGEYILAKINDYKEIEYPRKLDKMIDALESIVRSEEFNNEMSRFIPLDVQQRTFHKSKFLDFLINENSYLLTEVRKVLLR